MSEPNAEAGKITSFTSFMQQVEGGKLHDDLTREIPDINGTLSNHVINNGGVAKGKLKLEVEFTLKDGVMEVTGSYDVTLPKEKRGRSIFWLTPDNHFTQANPKQDRLPFRDVNDTRGTRSA